MLVSMDASALNATIVHRREIHERLAILHVRPDALPFPVFEPGQFVQLGLIQEAPPRPGSQAGGAPRLRISKRSYSIASSPLEREHYEFFLALVEEGRLTPHLWKLGEGDRCFVDSRAIGTFTLRRVPPGIDLVLVATGTGVAPYVSMLRTYRADPPWRRAVLIHGARHASELAYDLELEAHARSDPRFRYLPVVSRDPETWLGEKGHVQVALAPDRFAALAGFPLDSSSCHVLLCGNPDMIRSVRDLLSPLGFAAPTADAPGNLHYERYW
jgi:ferredoxin--NADP+ reductase